MKITRYFSGICMALVGFFLTGCQTGFSEILSEQEPVKGVITLRSQSELTSEDSLRSVFDIESRNNGDETLVYTLEVWSRETEPRCMLRKTMNGGMTGGVHFEISLIPGVYDFLFWADYGSGHYLTTNLRQVTVSTDSYRPGAQNDAFACVLRQVEWDGTSCNAILKRPLARINLHNTQEFDQSNTVSMIYDEFYTVYDVLTGEVSSPLRDLAVSFPETTVGLTLIGEDFLFVPAEGTMSFSVSVGDITKTMEDISLKENYSTNITSLF